MILPLRSFAALTVEFAGNTSAASCPVASETYSDPGATKTSCTPFWCAVASVSTAV